MRMIGTLFSECEVVIDDSATGRHCTARLLPNIESEVLQAHFPGHPVVPGATLLATVGELVGRMTEQKIIISNIKNIKFVSLIEPEEGQPLTIDVDLDMALLKVKATVSYKGAISSKMTMTCTTAF